MFPLFFHWIQGIWLFSDDQFRFFLFQLHLTICITSLNVPRSLYNGIRSCSSRGGENPNYILRILEKCIITPTTLTCITSLNSNLFHPKRWLVSRWCLRFNCKGESFRDNFIYTRFKQMSYILKIHFLNAWCTMSLKHFLGKYSVCHYGNSIMITGQTIILLSMLSVCNPLIASYKKVR